MARTLKITHLSNTIIFFIHNEKLKKLCSYAKFEEKTVSGEFEKTAQFYMMYSRGQKKT